MPEEKDKSTQKKAPKPAAGAGGGKSSKEGTQQAASKSAAAKEPVQPEGPHEPARLMVFYKKDVAPGLAKQFGYKTPMQVPRITKITLNMGVGEATADKKILDNAVGDMTKISGQKPVITKARKAIAGFK